MGVKNPPVAENAPAILPPICGQVGVYNPPSNAPSAESPRLDFTNITKGCQCTGGFKGDVCQFAPPPPVVAAAWRLSSMDMWMTFTISSLVVNLLTIEHGFEYFLFSS